MHVTNNFAFESSRMVIYCRERKKEYPVKKKHDKDCYYINIDNKKITVTDIVKPMISNVMFKYIFDGWIIDFPCIAFHWWYCWAYTGTKTPIHIFKQQHLQMIRKVTRKPTKK